MVLLQIKSMQLHLNYWLGAEEPDQLVHFEGFFFLNLVEEFEYLNLPTVPSNYRNFQLCINKSMRTMKAKDDKAVYTCINPNHRKELTKHSADIIMSNLPLKIIQNR